MGLLEDMKAKLAAREGVPGYEKNCEVLKAEIARHEAAEQHPFDDSPEDPSK